MMAQWKRHARGLKRETYTLYLAYKDRRTPWYAKVFVALVVGYAFSPIDLIPDPIPVLGYLDDLVLVPLGVALALRMIPSPVLTECRAKTQVRPGQGSKSWVGVIVIVVLWLSLAVLAVALIARVF